ncbi:MAG: ATP-dependent DNA helicase RecG [Phycisphaerales bacterium]|nr:ATP-dependent DNA helicase RecG [Phycisphaerales bacterium]MDP6891345.1 ATP-dependent DNA helicase RecG [Phycisphaerales bacterium]
MTTDTMTLTTSIADLPGAEPNTVAAMGRLGLRCVADLLLHMPTRYRRSRPWQAIDRVAAAADGDTTDEMEVHGEIVSIERGFGRAAKIEVVIEDDSGEIDLVFFNQPWVQRKLHPGMKMQATGRPRVYKSRVQIANPQWRRIEDDAPLIAPTSENTEAELIPVYPASEELPSDRIALVIRANLDRATALLDDHLPEDYRRSHGLPTLGTAYSHLHRPQLEEHIDSARRRLILDELLMLQLGVMMKRFHRRTHLHAVPLPLTTGVAERIAARIPFSPTEAQQRVMAEIGLDLSGTIPMNRLLQGDVGSGKTVVALAAMLQAVAHGKQAAMIAPTELLAEQHDRTLSRFLQNAPLRMGLLTGSLAAAARRELVEAISEGDIDIVIGTHAVLTEDVIFRDLAVAVTDEQHRFGVRQRASLRDKAADVTRSPHQLVMTATPIPRTLSLTIFGDLDVSTIDEMPPGRMPVHTVAIGRSAVTGVYEDITTRVQQGERAFVVVPVIDESEAGLTDLHTHHSMLASGPLSSCRLEAMHGRLNQGERDDIMERFRRGDIDVLVATTVIEVGVDIPEATVMVIEDADRFGLAQLHQLRGRVGRGQRGGRCVLIAEPATDEGRQRIAAMVETDNGFQIAERDLAIRGPGELFGARQSGVPPFRIASLPRDMELLALARRDAEDWIERDPLLTQPEHALLRKRLLKAHGRWLGLGDVG